MRAAEQTKLMELAETAREAHKLALEAMNVGRDGRASDVECDQLIESPPINTATQLNPESNTERHSNSMQSSSKTLKMRKQSVPGR